jgi:hypothetical protein
MLHIQLPPAVAPRSRMQRKLSRQTIAGRKYYTVKPQEFQYAAKHIFHFSFSDKNFSLALAIVKQLWYKYL